MLKPKPKVMHSLANHSNPNQRRKGICFLRARYKVHKAGRPLSEEPVRWGEILATVVDITSRVTSFPSLAHPHPSSPSRQKHCIERSRRLSGQRVIFLSLCTCSTVSACVGRVPGKRASAHPLPSQGVCACAWAEGRKTNTVVLCCLCEERWFSPCACWCVDKQIAPFTPLAAEDGPVKPRSPVWMSQRPRGGIWI